MNFLPEADQEYLRSKGISYVLVTEIGPDGKESSRGVIFPSFEVPSNLRAQQNGSLVVCQRCELLVMILPGYATTKLDNFYSIPHLKRPDGTDPQNATGVPTFFGRPWQFWSRHLPDSEWRVGKDGLSTFLSYIHNELRIA
jgi:hypothetical protein